MEVNFYSNRHLVFLLFIFCSVNLMAGDLYIKPEKIMSTPINGSPIIETIGQYIQKSPLSEGPYKTDPAKKNQLILNKSTRSNPGNVNLVKPKSTIINLYGGTSIPIGEGTKDINWGFNSGASVLVKVNPYIALGGNGTINRWSVDAESDLNIDAIISYTELLGLIRISTSSIDGTSGFLEFGAGWYFGTLEVSGYEQLSPVNDFGISLAGGLNVKMLLIMPSFKIVFSEGDNYTKWMGISVGLNVGATP